MLPRGFTFRVLNGTDGGPVLSLVDRHGVEQGMRFGAVGRAPTLAEVRSVSIRLACLAWMLVADARRAAALAAAGGPS